MSSEQKKMQQQYPKFKDWIFYTIECVPDGYELPRLLMSYGSKLVVISPTALKSQIINTLTLMLSNNQF